MVFSNDRVTFKVTKFGIKCRAVFLTLLSLASISLSPAFLLVAVWFSLAFHRQSEDIKQVVLFEATVECPHGTANVCFTSADNDSGCPTSNDLFLDVGHLFWGEGLFLGATFLLIFFVSSKVLLDCFPFFKEVDNITDGLF